MILFDTHAPPLPLKIQSPQRPFVSLHSPLTPTSRSLKEANLDGSEIASSETVPSSFGEEAPQHDSGNTLKVRETELDRETTDATLRLSTENLGENHEVRDNSDTVDHADHLALSEGINDTAPSMLSDDPLKRSHYTSEEPGTSATKANPPLARLTAASTADLASTDSSANNLCDSPTLGSVADSPTALTSRAVALGTKDEGFFNSTFQQEEIRPAPFLAAAARNVPIEPRRHTSPAPWSTGRSSTEFYHPQRLSEAADLNGSRARPARGQERARSSLELSNLRRQSTQTSANAEINRMRNSIIVKRNIQKRRRDFLKEDQIYIGNKITEGHQNFVMAYNMLTGIRVAVSRCSGVMKKLNDSDFRATKKLTFNMDGSELTPSSKYDFKFKDYSPAVFRELRSLFGIDPADYLISITGKYILSELGSPGKSGSFFYYSRDFRFIIKTIHHSEHKQLRRMLKDYYEHVKNNPNTLISQFYGLHRLKVHGGMKKVHFIVMNNLFPPHRDIHLKYDLKGSTWGRATKIPKDATDLSQLTLKDLNWLERKDKIKFGPDKRKFFTEQLEADVKLLKKINVMDYSLLLGIHDVKKGNTDGRQKLSVFDPKSNMKSEVIKTNPRDIDRGVDLPHNVFPGRSKYIFYGHDGGIRATNENNEPLPEIYYLGIIDCLTNYSAKKRLETFFRSLKHSRSTISAIPAKEYGERFFKFMIKGITRDKEKNA